MSRIASRRLAILEVHADYLIAMSQATHPLTLQCVENALPGDAVFVEGIYYPDRRVVGLVVESADFAPVETGKLMPTLPLPVFKRVAP